MNHPSWWAGRRWNWCIRMSSPPPSRYISTRLFICGRFISHVRSSDTIQQDKAAVLAYLRMKHKDPYKGYVLCAIVSSSLSRFVSSLMIIIHAVQDSCARCTCGKRVLCLGRRQGPSYMYQNTMSGLTKVLQAFHNNSTAQEVTVITQYAKDFQLRVSARLVAGLLALSHVLIHNLHRDGQIHRPCRKALYLPP